MKKTIAQMVAAGRAAVQRHREARAAVKMAEAELLLAKAKVARLRAEIEAKRAQRGIR